MVSKARALTGCPYESEVLHKTSPLIVLCEFVSARRVPLAKLFIIPQTVGNYNTEQVLVHFSVVRFYFASTSLPLFTFVKVFAIVCIQQARVQIPNSFRKSYKPLCSLYSTPFEIVECILAIRVELKFLCLINLLYLCLWSPPRVKREDG